MTWISACSADSIDAEAVVRFDQGSKTFAIFRSLDGTYYATDGLCTHEKVHLADGLVVDNTIECPKHGGSFDYTNGEALGAPVCISLRTYPTKVEQGMVLIDVE
jgi:3-phenylpropionate/trans-cinnamate dioxygenase ferredoxin subunit